MKKLGVFLLSVLVAFLLSPVALAEPMLTDGVKSNIAAEDVEVNSADKTLIMFGTTVDLSGSYEKNLFVAGSKVNINATVQGDAYIFAETIEFGEAANIEGILNYNDDAKIIGEIKAKETKTYSPNISLPTFSFGVVGDFAFMLWSILAFIVLAVILVLAAPKLFKAINKKTAKYNIKQFFVDVLLGGAFLLVTPIAMLLMVFTIIGIPAAIVLLLVYIIMLIIAMPISGYYIGKIILKKVDKVPAMVGAATLGVAIIQLVSIIPYIGWLIELTSVVFGVGLLLKVARK